MAKGENGTRDPGRSQRAAQKPALAEILGHDGGPQTPKSAPGAAVAPSGKQTTTQELFPSKMLKTGGKARADAGGARLEGATFSTPGGGPQHTPRPAPGTAARQPADKGQTPTTVQDGGLSANTNSKPDKRQNTGESGDSAEQNRTTLGTASCILTRLRYSKENGDSDKILSGIQVRRNSNISASARRSAIRLGRRSLLCLSRDEEKPATRTRASDITINGPAAEGIDNKIQDRRNDRLSARARLAVVRLDPSKLLYLSPDEEKQATRTQGSDITRNGPAAEGIDNREIDRGTTTHNSHATSTSKSAGSSTRKRMKHHHP
jgi:hypothetical protein